MNKKTLRILGTRGIPAKHGGFETFAEHLALYLINRQWDVIVYCQGYGKGPKKECMWNGVKLIELPISAKGPVSTILFDLLCVLHANRKEGVMLTLGYNTAIFSIFNLFTRKKNLINMDGIEWKREKWNLLQKIWLYLNERIACLFADALIADHPEIEKHLRKRVKKKKIYMIPYGADEISDADRKELKKFGLEPSKYVLVVARPEPEYSILEIVSAYSKNYREIELVLLGDYTPEENSYHRKVLSSAGKEVKFLGAIYEQSTVKSLRFYARLYIHGHTVGGTNPSLVEAMGCGSAILAQDNKYNRWVAGEGARYFSNTEECEIQLDTILNNRELINKMKSESRKQFSKKFVWNKILLEYEEMLEEWI